jgi:hypothetical protein
MTDRYSSVRWLHVWSIDSVDGDEYPSPNDHMPNGPCDGCEKALQLQPRSAIPALIERVTALEDAAADYLDAVTAYLDPDNQFTDSRLHHVKETHAVLCALLEAESAAVEEVT